MLLSDGQGKKPTKTLPIDGLDQKEEESWRESVEQLISIFLSNEDPTKTIKTELR